MGMFDKSQRQQGQPMQQAYDQAAPASRDPFSKIGDADGSNQGIYPEPGLYPCLYVDVLKVIQSRKGDDLFIAEFDILQSDVNIRPPGTRMSWMANLTRHEAAPGNVKTFLATLMDVPLEEVDAESSKYACSPDNPCHGRLIRLEASIIKTKEKKTDFTLCKWFTLPNDVQAQAEELRKQAGFAPF
jgi:hypothetical protein